MMIFHGNTVNRRQSLTDSHWLVATNEPFRGDDIRNAGMAGEQEDERRRSDPCPFVMIDGMTTRRDFLSGKAILDAGQEAAGAEQPLLVLGEDRKSVV